MKFEVTWLGHSTRRIETVEAKILLDSFIGDEPAAKVASTSVSPTHIFISLGHYDHLGLAVEIARGSETAVNSVLRLDGNV